MSILTEDQNQSLPPITNDIIQNSNDNTGFQSNQQTDCIVFMVFDYVVANHISFSSIPNMQSSGSTSSHGPGSFISYPTFQNQNVSSVSYVSQNGHNQIQTPTHFNTCINNKSQDVQPRMILREKNYVQSRIRFSCLQHQNSYQGHNSSSLEPNYENHSKRGQFLFHSDALSEFIQIRSQPTHAQDTMELETRKDDHSLYSKFLQKENNYCNSLLLITNIVSMSYSSSDRQRHSGDSMIDYSIV